MIQWYPGHMTKAKRNIESDLALVDMIIEITDARAPLSSRNPDLEKYIGKKAHVLVLNKADLANEQQTKQWIRYYRQKGYYPAAINAARKQGINQLTNAVKSASTPIYERLKAKGRLPRSVRAMVVGVPNCGKSTVINALAPAAMAKTANKPGVTKGRQWVKTNIGIELLDTPGLLWPRFADESVAFRLAVLGCISDQVFPVYDITSKLALILAQEYPQALKERYKLQEIPDNADDIFSAIARSRGLIGQGGKERQEDAALVLLKEFRSGKMGRITLDALNND